jgi:4-amino-4-deoxy-L-arabinose transferase-like glycosyltransferase
LTSSAYKKLMLALLVLAALLRLILAWVNPPMNAFDDHLGPIRMIMESGVIPGKRACWQCYQPPVFYYSSAMIGLVATKLGLAASYIPKLMQMLSCVYGILSVWVIYLILNRVRLSGFARLMAFGVICFLPRHIYMSAMHSNDSLAVLLVALGVYLMLLLVEKDFSWRNLLALSAVTSGAIFTKYTAFVVLPMILVAVVLVILKGEVASRLKQTQLAALAVILPTLLLGAYMYDNQGVYGEPLPWNDAIMDTTRTQVSGEGGVSFFDFRPWTVIEVPVMRPENVGSFWTLIHGRMWFDMDPRFILLTDRDLSLWERYFGWLRGHNSFPETIKLSAFTQVTGASLILLGLMPLALMLLGGTRLLLAVVGVETEDLKVNRTMVAVLVMLMLFNVAGVVALTLKASAYSSIKAIYLLVSLPASAVFLGAGIMLLEKNRVMRSLMLVSFAALFVLVLLHFYHVIYSFHYFA